MCSKTYPDELDGDGALYELVVVRVLVLRRELHKDRSERAAPSEPKAMSEAASHRTEASPSLRWLIPVRLKTSRNESCSVVKKAERKLTAYLWSLAGHRPCSSATL